ncbi:alpha/beta-hydrolase [Cladorrhinum sp. PSN332]|nr:alpha/beta-hydrolase [Cladorrhinum sp. PSN332]
MTKTSLALAAASLLHTTQAAGVPKTCNDYKIPINITSTNAIFGLDRFKTNFDVADFIDIYSSRDETVSKSVLSNRTENVTATYTISATFCRPGHGTPAPNAKKSVLIATHGLGYDRAYWDPPQLDKSKYNFAEWALSQGYSIFYYDRLGVGKSQQVSGYVAQLSNEQAILQEITKLVRGGHYTGSIGKPDKLILIGHSFGSVLSNQVVATHGDLIDGVVLTGFSYNQTAFSGLQFTDTIGLRIAAQQQPGKWRQLDTGYLTNVDIYSNVAGFFKAPNYDPQIARFAEDHKQPIGITELISVVPEALSLPLNFKGAAQIISGKFDFIFCQSDCDGVLENPGAAIFSQAKAFEAVSFPGAGHGLNFHLNAADAFKRITDFLSANGL